MMRTYICFVILVTFVHSRSNRCLVNTESGEIKTVCCLDYEEIGNDCIRCPKGYTSIIGQNCRPCPRSTYGYRCSFVCVCIAGEICDHVEGCVEPSLQTSTLEYETSDTTTSPRNLDARSNGENIDGSVQDTTTSPRNFGATSNGENIDSSVQGLLAREIIVYFVLSIFVMVFGIGFCYVLLKNKTLTKQIKVTIIQSQNPAIPQNSQNIEMEHRLYEIIDETDMLDDQHVQQLQMSSAYLDVIEDSNIRDSDERNQDNPCKLLSTAQTHTEENKLKEDCRSLMSSGSTSSCEDSTQDYLNPYQPMIQSEMSPPEVTEYLKLAKVNCRIDSGLPNHHKEALSKKKDRLQHPRDVEKNAMTNTYEIPKCLSNIRGRESKSVEKLNTSTKPLKMASSGKDETNMTQMKITDFYNLLKNK